MKILYFGTSAFAIPALRALLEHGYDVVGVVTQPDRPSGRGGKLAPTPVKVVAIDAQLPVLQPESCRTPEFLAQARALAPDFNVVAAYGQFLPDSLLSVPRYGSVNLHGSLLPKYRGAAPIQRAIWEGEETSGVCLMWMARAMDAGDVIACAEEAILPEDTAGTLSEKLAARAAELLITWLPRIAQGTAPRTVQDPAQVTFAPMINKEERQIDWAHPAEVIWRQIRALAPSPTAMTALRDTTIKILEARPVRQMDQCQEGTPGEVVESNPKVGLFVATGTGWLQILSLQPAGKRIMSAADFLRGYHVVIGERFATQEAT